MQQTEFFVSTHLMHAEQTCIYGAQSCSADTASSRYLPIYAPHPYPTDLQKAPMNDLNNPILLLRRHLVIAWQTELAPENIGSNIDSRAFYIGICAASAVAFDCDKRVGPVYRLHMHGLPNPSTYQAKVSKTLQSFTQAEHTIFSME